MAASSSYCSPSSSAVTIPTPGKSILKRPPPTQQSLFSRFTKFLPTTNQTQNLADDETKPLKRAHFILPEIAIVYPISSINPPSAPGLKDEKRAIEDKEYERRRRVVRGPPRSPGAEPEGWWSMDKVESFYRECCAGCEEEPDPAISIALKNASGASPRALDLSGVQLTPISASILSDVFTIEWGLRKLVFRECDLDEHTLKPILHSLLIPGSLSFLSVASNRRLKAPAFRVIGAYAKKAKSLQFLDLSQTSLDKRSIEYIVMALETAPEPGLESLRLDDCSLRPAALEALCRAVRTSSLKHISLRHNRISSAGGVALALMIRDYPDAIPTAISPSPSGTGTPASSTTSSPTSSVSSLPIVSPPATPTISSLPPPTKGGPIIPPPRHPSIGLQTTYTPYIPRSKRRPGSVAPPSLSVVSAAAATAAAGNLLSPTGQPIPIITSSQQGGVTTRHPTSTNTGSAHARQEGSVGRHDTGPSAALLDRVRALDALPRLGALRTLDLKGNDLRNGITYLAQVLKRNRTLKLLNLSENKLDVACLVAIAEALKYNSCLETLDMNKNPCSGPSLEGIQSLRTAFTLNTSLKRLFLSSTQLTSAGAIALAEFLPESMSLLHLDLTNNALDLAGVMALNSGLKANHVMRCLDMNIPPGDEKFARMCREILNTCVRNTEEAERNSRSATSPAEGAMTLSVAAQSGRGQRKGVWGLIEDSELAKSIRKDEEKRIENDVVVRARACIAQMTALVSASSPMTTPFSLSLGSPQDAGQKQVTDSAATKIGTVIVELRTVIQETEDPERLEELLVVNDQLIALLKQIPPVDAGSVNRARPRLSLQGLGLSFDGVINGNGSQPPSQLEDNGSEADHVDGEVDDGAPPSANATEGTAGAVEAGGEEEEEDTTPTTPRIDKGKARAEPEKEEPEKVLSPSYVIDSEDEDEEGVEYIPEEIAGQIASPTQRSRSWVEEEGEIFRKGAVLLGPEELEGEYAGEELRKELLEAMVERPPPRPIQDEFGVELLGPGSDLIDPTPLNAPVSPVFPAGTDASVGSPTVGTTEPTKSPPPKPYIPRRTSSSIMGIISPALGSPSLSQGVVSGSGGGSVLGSPVVDGSGSPNALAHVPMFVKRTNSGG